MERNKKIVHAIKRALPTFHSTPNNHCTVSCLLDKSLLAYSISTYDHRVWRTRLPVRPAVLKDESWELSSRVVGYIHTLRSLFHVQLNKQFRSIQNFTKELQLNITFLYRPLGALKISTLQPEHYKRPSRTKDPLFTTMDTVLMLPHL